MILTRRTVLAGASAAIVWPATAETAPPPLAAYERASGGRIGLYAENLVTGAALAWRAHERFAMCSTFKASLAAFVLARVDRGEDRLETMIPFGARNLQPYAPVARQHLAQAAKPEGEMSVGDMGRAIVELSDNTCANLLLAHVGGPAALTRFWRAQQDTMSRLDHDEPLLNRSPPGDPHDTTTSAAMAGNLRRFLLGEALSAASRERLTRWMIGCKTGADRLRGGLPAAWTIGDKTGNNGTDAFGDIAVAWPTPNRPIVVCAYTQGGAPAAPRVVQVFAEIGRMVADRLA